MSKFTSKRLMEAMGLKVGDRVEFPYKSVFRTGVVYVVGNEAYLRDEEDKSTFHITYILGTEYTILPRYTLTEDEKVIVRCLNGYEFITRALCGDIWCISEKCKMYHCISGLNHLFQFIKENEAASIDELRKCL